MGVILTLTTEHGERKTIMWTRKELKQRAKEALQRNYWKIMLVAAFAAILGGGLSSSGSSASSRVSGVMAADMTIDEEKNENVAAVVTEDGIVFPLENAREELGDTTVTVYMVMFAVIAIVIVLVILAIAFAFSMLLYNPFHVGVQRFMLKSVDDKAEVKEVLYAFDHSYKNVVRTMFHKDIRVLLWSLLFVIPGIYKSILYSG